MSKRRQKGERRAAVTKAREKERAGRRRTQAALAFRSGAWPLPPELQEHITIKMADGTHLRLGLRPSRAQAQLTHEVAHVALDAAIVRAAPPPRAARALAHGLTALEWVALAVPPRLADEEVGDAHERLAKIQKAGASLAQQAFAVWCAVIWLAVHGLQDGVAGFTAPKQRGAD